MFNSHVFKNYFVCINMQPLYTQLEYENSKSTDLLLLKCYGCGSSFKTEKKQIKYAIKHNINRGHYCSLKCKGKHMQENVELNCVYCEKTFKKKKREYRITKNKNNFCSKSCAATYNNKHKSHGNRRSKLELWLGEQITSIYPELEVHYNRKDTINSELDIYIPSLKFAIEINGIFHYEPIFGKEKLDKIKNNDERKFQACIENSIEMAWIDSSQLKYFKPKNAQKYLDIVCQLINNKLF